MKGKFFIDTSVVLYAISNSDTKSEKAQHLLSFNPTISTQVIAESINVMLKKFKLGKQEAFEKALDIITVCNLAIIKESTIKLAFEVSIKYQFSYWDSLIVAVALEQDCETLYSEDMSHDILINEKLKIVNPFL